MERINYKKLIDPFLIPVIKYLREERGVETLFCCQGETSEDGPDEDHSKRGYILAKYSPQAFKEFFGIFNSHISRIPYEIKENIEIEIRRHPEYGNDPVILVKLQRKEWPTKLSLKEEWEQILSDIKTQEK